MKMCSVTEVDGQPQWRTVVPLRQAVFHSALHHASETKHQKWSDK